MSSILFEYDEEETLAYIAEENQEIGLKKGLKKGHVEERISQIIKKIQKSKSLETIADELECEVDEIRMIYDVIQKLGVESSMEEIMKELR